VESKSRDFCTVGTPTRYSDCASLHQNRVAATKLFPCVQELVEKIWKDREIGLSQKSSRLKSHEVFLINDVFWDEIAVNLAKIAVTYGDFAVQKGKIAVTYGDFAVQKGKIAVTYGDFAVQKGKIAVNLFLIAVQKGKIAVTYGDFAVQKGKIAVNLFLIAVQKGKIAVNLFLIAVTLGQNHRNFWVKRFVVRQKRPRHFDVETCH